MILFELFFTFFKIGLFTFGGGYAMLSLIQNEIVEQQGWLTASQFADIVAVSQMTPGPIAINSATYIGYTVGGFWGSVVATFAVCLPALTIMLALTKFFLKLKDNHYVHSVLVAMRPVVVGMIAAAALLLMFPKNSADGTFIDHWSWILFGATLYASYKKVNPILLILLSAVAGIVIYAL
mgnify:CR=1 FL=1